MFNWWPPFGGVVIADPTRKANAMAVNADGSINADVTVDATIGDFAVANASPPSLSEGAPAPGSVDLSGNMRTLDKNSVAALALLQNLTPFGYHNIATNTGTLLKTGAGTLGSVTINTKGTVASVINVYDGTTNGGTLIATIDSLNLQGQFGYDVSFSTGLFVQSTGTVAPNYTVASK